MGNTPVKPLKKSSYDVYLKHREKFVYTNTTQGELESNNLQIRLVGMYTEGPKVYCVIESLIYNDLKRDEFIPNFGVDLENLSPIIVIQPSVSDSSKYKLIGIEATYFYLAWFPFVPKESRQSFNQSNKVQCAKMKQELIDMIPEGTIFEKEKQ